MKDNISDSTSDEVLKLLKKLADSNFFQCSTENLDNILSNIDTNDVEFKHPEYSVTEF